MHQAIDQSIEERTPPPPSSPPSDGGAGDTDSTLASVSPSIPPYSLFEEAPIIDHATALEPSTDASDQQGGSEACGVIGPEAIVQSFHGHSESEEPPVFYHAAIPESIISSVDGGFEVYRAQMADESSGAEERSSLCEKSEGGSVEDGLRGLGLRDSRIHVSAEENMDVTEANMLRIEERRAAEAGPQLLVPCEDLCSDFPLEDKKTAAFEPAAASIDSNETLDIKEFSLIHCKEEDNAKVDDSELVGSIEAPHPHSALEEKNTADFEPASTVVSNEMLESKNASTNHCEDGWTAALGAQEIDDSQLIGSTDAPLSDSALVDMKSVAYESASTVNEILESKEANIIRCEEGDIKAVDVGLGAQDIDNSQLLGSIDGLRSDSVLEVKKIAAFEPVSTIDTNETYECKDASIVHCEDESEVGVGVREVNELQFLASLDAPHSDSALEDKKTTAFELASTTDSIASLESKEASVIHCENRNRVTMEAGHGAQEVNGSEFLDFSEVPYSNITLEEKSDVAFEPATTIDSNETLETKDVSVVQCWDRDSGPMEVNDLCLLEPSSTNPVNGTLEGMTANILHYTEEGGIVQSGLISQDMNISKITSFPSSPPSTSSEEDGESPNLDPTRDDDFNMSAADDVVGEVQMEVKASELVMEDSHMGRGRGQGKKKRGRSSKGQGLRVSAKKKEKEDEEVCFICFDGGDLVVCDRRGCPKVYHPSCVNRDEAFFRAKGQWNCGWHICSNCEKKSQFMCYTCTFSLCKGCVSEAGFVRVRGNKGFCVTCMSIVMLIESNDDEQKKSAGIDFDDRTSWMYLFKDYWLDLKGKILLTLEELTSAKAPLEDSNVIAHNECSDYVHKACSDHEVSSDSSSGPPEVRISSKKKEKKRLRNILKEESSTKEEKRKRLKNIVQEEGSVKESKKKRLNNFVQEDGSAKGTKKKRLKNIVQAGSAKETKKKHLKDIVQEEGPAKETKKKRLKKIVQEEGSTKEAEIEGTSTSEAAKWASKELLELVSHMKDGDTSVLSQFDVQALLLEYIKRNNLRDPRRKSHIICDSRLQDLFGKTRVGHFEMLKLLESHFLTKEPSHVVTDDNQEGVVDPEPSQIETEGNSDISIKLSSDRVRKLQKRVHEKEPQTNLDDYAAIDVHNINLMYLRRNLMEGLVDDIDTFEEKVVGAFVRIRISGSVQRQDMYRLVQVIGTGKAAEKYRTGKKTTDFTLEILNLDKAEFITIDSISNQEFTEEECKRLRQSIKCGLIGRVTVGDIQEKASVLQAARVIDWIESEKQRLGNLRDRASEKGRRKELRECVEKLQLLNTPEERVRRLNEVPDIHSDPKMDPDYESTDNEEEEPDHRQQDNFRNSSYGRGSDGISPIKGGYVSSSNWNTSHKSINNKYEPKRNTQPRSAWDIGSSTKMDDRTNHSSMNQLVRQTSGSEAQNFVNNAQTLVNSGLPASTPIETTPVSIPAVTAASPSVSETEKIWHYQDPSGKIQGPFMITQLRKWNTSGYFPTNLKIWRASERQEEDSILLSDALNGKFQKDLPEWKPQLQYNSTPQPTNVSAREANSSAPRSEPITPRGLQPGGQSYERQQTNWSSSSQQTSPIPNIMQWNTQVANNQSNQWISDSNNPMSTPQPSNGGWTGVQAVSLNFPSPVTPHVQGSNVAAAGTNLAVGWSSNPLQNMLQQMVYSTPSASVPNSAQMPQMIGGSGYLQLPIEQKMISEPVAMHQNQSSGNAPLDPNPTIQQIQGNVRAATQTDERLDPGCNTALADGMVFDPSTGIYNKEPTPMLDSAPNHVTAVIQPAVLPNASEFPPAQGSEATSVKQITQTPARVTKPSRWDTGSGSTSGNGQSSGLTAPPSNSSQQPTPPAQWRPGSAPEPSQPPTNNVFIASAPNPGPVTGPAQANSNVFWGAAMQAGPNAGWGAANPGNVNLMWGIPNQGNPNPTVGGGTPLPANPNAIAGWGMGIPAQGDPAASVAWGTPNPKFGSGAPMGNMNQNSRYGTPVIPRSGQGTTNPGMNPSKQQNETRDHQGFYSGIGRGRQQGEEWSSWPHQMVGFCKFHESGYCKKGTSCNYIHR